MKLPNRLRPYFLYGVWIVGVLLIVVFVVVTMIQKATKTIARSQAPKDIPTSPASNLLFPQFGHDRGVKVQHPTATFDLELYYPSDMELYEGYDSWMIRRLSEPKTYLLIQRRGMGQLTKASELLNILQKDTQRRYDYSQVYQSKNGLDGYRTSWTDQDQQVHYEYLLADNKGAFYLFSTTSEELYADLDLIVRTARFASRE